MNRIRFVVLLVSLLLAGNLVQTTLTYGQATPNPNHISINGFHLVSPTDGWIWTDHLYWTKDSGQTWKDITPSNSNGGQLAAVYFIDNHFGKAIFVTPGSDVPFTYSLAYTTNGGATWTTNPLNLFSAQDSTIYSGLVSMQFLDATTGWLVIKAMTSQNFDIGALFKTTDGGATWTKLQSAGGGSGPVYFVTDQIGWSVSGTQENVHLYRTQDGGKSWQLQIVGTQVQLPSLRFYRLPQFVNPKDGLLTSLVITGENSTSEVYITHNGGKTWQLDSTLPGRGTISLLDSTHWLGTIAGKNQVMWSMSPVATHEVTNQDPDVANIAVMDFVSANVGLAESYALTCPSSPCTPFKLLFTNNAGQTWQSLTLP